MDTSDQALVGSRRRMRTVAEKRRIVEETLVGGASVALIARKHDLNANLLFGWRRLYKQGVLEACREPVAKLLPVTVTTPTIVAARGPVAEVAKSRARAASGTTADSHIEIEWPDGVRVRVHGAVEPGVLGTLLAALAKRR